MGNAITAPASVTPAVVDFHGQALTVITGPTGERLVAMKPICEAIGLDWDGQRQRIKRHQVLSQGAVIITAPSASGDQEHTCLPLDMLNGWLFGVDVNRCREDIRPTLIQYQRECYGALAAYWQQGEAINPRSCDTVQPEHVERRPLRGRLVLFGIYSGQLWFSAANLCSALDIGSADRFLRALPERHKRKLTQGTRGLWLVDAEAARRAGDYCKLGVAEEFRPWLDHLIKEFSGAGERQLAWAGEVDVLSDVPAEIEQVLGQRLRDMRFMVHFELNGEMRIKAIDPDTILLRRDRLANYIGDPEGPPRSTLPDILGAVSQRMKGLH